MVMVAPSDASLSGQLIDPRRLFRLLVLYRWFSLIPPLVSLAFLASAGDAGSEQWLALAIAVLANGLITIYHASINRNLLRRPWLIGVDLLLVTSLILLTGGWETPYYLYVLSPLLAAAFFFHLRGALLATSVLAGLYLIAVLGAYRLSGEPPNWLAITMALVGFYLIAGTFGLASGMVARLRLAGSELADAHRDLQVIHDLTLSLQHAADVTEVEARVLEAVTTELGFSRAVVALVDQDEAIISSWMERSRQGMIDSRLSHSAQLPLTAEAGAIGETLLSGQRRLAIPAPFTNDEALNNDLNMAVGHIFPLLLRDKPVGVLLVDADRQAQAPGQDETLRIRSLEAILNQAAVSLGTTMMCINRAQRMAVQEERIRIAQDIHDTVSQSLFGIVFTLDGCLKLLPEHPQEVKPELERVLSVAEETRAEIRKSILDIWPSKMTAELFVADLQKYAAGICQADQLRIQFSVSGGFSRLSPRARRSLYRIGQEALANIAHHAGASEAQVCLDVTTGRAMFSVRDNGRGFDSEQALKREYGREHFGLWGMQERARSLGGSCEISSSPGAGASVIVDIPVA